MTRHVLGRGILNWSRQERITGRWGSVTLYPDTRPIMADAPSLDTILRDPSRAILEADAITPHEGKRGRLLARILSGRASWTTGAVHCLTPPDQEFGTVVVEEDECGLKVGIRTGLDKGALGAVHGSLVELLLEIE